MIHSDPSTYRLRLLLSVLELGDMLALSLISSFLPLFLNQEFKIDLVEATFLAGVASFFKQIAYSASSPLWGWLSDRVGSKKMVIRVLVGHAAAHLLMAFSRNTYEFMAFLLVDGILGSISTPIYAMLTSFIDPEDLPQVLSYQMSLASIGHFIGPSLMGILIYYFGFRMTMLTASLMFASLLLPVLLFRFRAPTKKLSMDEIPIKEESGISSSFGLDFIGLVFISATTAFINPIIPLCLYTLGIVEQSSLIYYTSLLATLSSLSYLLVNPIGTKYVKKGYLFILSIGAMVMILAQSLFLNVYVFLILSICARSIQAPLISNLLGGGGRKRRRGLHMGILNTGRYLGGAIGPFIAATIATTIDLRASFISIAFIQFGESLILFLRNKKLNTT